MGWARSATSGSATGSTSLARPAPTYTLGNADVGHTIDVVANYTDGHGTPESVTSAATAAVTNVNDAPTGTVTISGTAQEDQVLTASNTLADADGLGAISYQWQRDGVNIAGATGTTYTLGNADVGHTIDVVAKYTDGHGTAESVASAATATVTNVNDPPTGSVTISGTAQENQVLTASNTLADADGLGAISYQWQRDGVNVVGATGADLYARQCRRRPQHRCGGEVYRRPWHGGERDQCGDRDGHQRQRRADRHGDDQRDGAGEPGPDGVEHAGGCRWAGRDQLPVAARRGRTWPGRPAPPIRSAMPMSATPSMWWRSYTDGHGTAESVASAATAAVTNVNDPPTGSVTISGTAQENQVLTASNTLADADGLGAISYQWQRDGVNVAGATGADLYARQCRCRPHHRCGGEIYRRPWHGGERGECCDVVG